jgi:hypothetical protein
MKKILPLLLLIAGFILLCKSYSEKTDESFQRPTLPRAQSKSTATSGRATETAGIPKPQTKPVSDSSSSPTVPQKKQLHQSMIKMNSLLKKYTLTNHSLKEIIDRLDALKMAPVLYKDSNPYSGSMFILRTESPLPGTRYFHAQYFSDNKTEPYLQHMSFDIPPEKNGFQRSINAVKSTFGNLNKPTIVKKDFIMWPWKKGYNLWIQRLNKDNLSGDPFNAYDEKDVGTIKIAVEMDTVHGNGSLHGH